jgi:hypothetical protein
MGHYCGWKVIREADRHLTEPVGADRHASAVVSVFARMVIRVRIVLFAVPTLLIAIRGRHYTLQETS